MSAPALVVALLLVLGLGAGLWIGFALLSVGLISLEIFRDVPVARFAASDFWTTATTQELVTLPLFILMGELLFHTKLSDNLFSGLSPWTQRLPGRLFHVNVLGCTLFAAVSGSSAATTATVGRITLKELVARGYDRKLAMGSLAGAGTLGFLIPPSIPLIVYGVLADVSILELFIAGVLPGLILAASFMTYLGIVTTLRPGLAGASAARVGLGERLAALKDLLPVAFLIVMVIGSMYTGIASITEAAAVGVLGALVVSLAQRQLTWRNLRAALLGTVRTCSMIGLIICGALFLSKAVARLGIPNEVAKFIQELALDRYMLILILTFFYLGLGCILDGLSAIVMTLPIALPLVQQAGFDPIWFGIFLVVVIEMSQVTPPVGFNLFVIQGLTGEPLGRVARAAAPFCAIMVALVALITVFPEVATFVPKFGR